MKEQTGIYRQCIKSGSPYINWSERIVMHINFYFFFKEKLYHICYEYDFSMIFYSLDFSDFVVLFISYPSKYGWEGNAVFIKSLQTEMSDDSQCSPFSRIKKIQLHTELAIGCSFCQRQNRRGHIPLTHNKSW